MVNNSEKKLVFAVVVLMTTFMAPVPGYPVSLIEDGWVELDAKTDRGDNVHVASDGNKLIRVSLAFDGEKFCIDVAPYAQLEGPYVQSLKLLIDQDDNAGQLTRKIIVPFYSWKGVRRNGLILVITFDGSHLVGARVAANNNLDDVIYTFPSSEGN